MTRSKNKTTSVARLKKLLSCSTMRASSWIRSRVLLRVTRVNCLRLMSRRRSRSLISRMLYLLARNVTAMIIKMCEGSLIRAP